MYVIETERLKLTPLSLQDLKLCIVSKAQMDEKLGLKSGIDTLDDEMKRIFQIKVDNITSDKDNLLFYTYWVMVLKGNNHAIGYVGFKGIPDEQGRIEVGYGVDDEYRRNGYMTEALNQLISWVFMEHAQKVTAVTASTLKDNIPSQRVLEKVGMKVVREDTNYLFWIVLKTTPHLQ